MEDEREVRSYVVETLMELGYRVKQSPDGEAALAMHESNAFNIDLLLTDVVMPNMNGRQLADKLAKRQSGLKVLFMTGYSRNAIVHQGRLDAGVALIQKPLNRESLARKIRELLDHP